MVTRRARAGFSDKPVFPGRSKLILANLIVKLENFLRVFARPLLMIGFFIAFAWLGFFNLLYPWTHLLALVFFAVILCDALAKARAHFRPSSISSAQRRLEEASSLKHRPFDVLTDRPVTLDPAEQALWQAHKIRAEDQLKNLRWPHWKLSFANRDPFALRYALVIMLSLGIIFSWGVWGGKLLKAINPALGQSAVLLPTLDAWITPPEYTGLPPVMIATPAGARHNSDTIEVPAGSTLTAHLADEGDVPALDVNGKKKEFTANSDSDFSIAATITSGDHIAIHRGWESLGNWNIKVVADQPPQIAFSEPPSVTARKTVRLSYEAKDDYGVKAIIAKITPRESLPGTSNEPVELTLASPDAKDVKRTSFEDLTASPWAGLPVEIRLFATNAAGQTSTSEPVDFILPERTFFNPIARALVEERKKLLETPEDDGVRNETANVMASIAHQPDEFRDDPVILMSLRAGAVRLVLDRGEDAIPPVSDILWQSALRIEDGVLGTAEASLRRAQDDLADALDRGASEEEIQQLIDRLHEALAQYLAQLASHTAQNPIAPGELRQLMGPATNVLTPQDLNHLLDKVRDLSASGSRDAARQELSQLQQILENLSGNGPQITEQQKEVLQRMLALREIGHAQQKLLDETLRASQDKSIDSRNFAKRQEDLRKHLEDLVAQDKEDMPQGVNKSAQAMAAAGQDLRAGAFSAAMQHENEALMALKQGLTQMADNLQAAMLFLPRSGMGLLGAGRDPFGRSDLDDFAPDDGSVAVPDHLQVERVRAILNELERRAGESNRSKTEREYIERLLQNF